MNLIKIIIINRREKGLDFSNEIIIHKILYFLYGFYWKEYDEELFKADFRAWTHGPIEQGLRDHINKVGISLSKFEINDEQAQKVIYILEHEIYKRFFELSIIRLILYAQVTDPWFDNVLINPINLRYVENIKHINSIKIQQFFKKTNSFCKWTDRYVERRKLDLFTKRGGLIDKVID